MTTELHDTDRPTTPPDVPVTGAPDIDAEIPPPTEPPTGPTTGPTTEPTPVAARPLPALDEDWLSTGPKKGIRIRLPAAALVLVAVACLGMAGGARLAQSNGTASAAGGANGRQGLAGGAPTGAGGFGGGTTGTVQSVEGNKITLTTTNGQTVTVNLGDTTTITKSGTAAVSDITQGETLVVRGTTAADGSTTAQSVTIGTAAAATGQAPTGQASTGQAPTGQAPAN